MSLREDMICSSSSSLPTEWSRSFIYTIFTFYKVKNVDRSIIFWDSLIVEVIKILLILISDTRVSFSMFGSKSLWSTQLFVDSMRRNISTGNSLLSNQMKIIFLIKRICIMLSVVVKKNYNNILNVPQNEKNS